MTEEPQQLPIYIVTGANWTAEIELDEYNAQFDIETQMQEAATRAIEVFYRIREDFSLKLNPDSRNEKPLLGTTVFVHLNGSNTDDAVCFFTHICLGDGALYRKSLEVNTLLEKQITEIRQKKIRKEQETARAKEISEGLEDFSKKNTKESTKKSAKKKKSKKTDNPEEPPSINLF